METLIQLDGVLYQVKGKVILKDIDLDLKKNEVVALTGPNGAGKTTLSKIIMGVLKASKGRVLIENQNVEELKLFEIGRKIGYMFQNPTHQIFMSTVKEELSFAMKYNKCSEEEIEASVNTMMTAFNLDIIGGHLTYHLSQGEKQRVALATILMNKPEYLILDEPFKGLDEEHKQQTMEYLKSIHKQGLGLMLITHDQKMIDAFANRIIIMGGGRIEEDKVIGPTN